MSRADCEAARAAIDLESAGETLKQLDRLGRGRLSFIITDYRIRDVMLSQDRLALYLTIWLIIMVRGWTRPSLPWQIPLGALFSLDSDRESPR